MIDFQTFRQKLREMIDREIDADGQYATHAVMQLALQHELLRLDDKAEAFSDEEMEESAALIHIDLPWVQLDQRDADDARRRMKARQ